MADSWRIKPGLTLTYGLRYENDTPPWETNGLEVAPTFPLQNFWAQRVGGAAQGIPSYALANAEIRIVWWGQPTGNRRLVWPPEDKLRPAPGDRLQSTIGCWSRIQDPR